MRLCGSYAVDVAQDVAREMPTPLQISEVAPIFLHAPFAFPLLDYLRSFSQMLFVFHLFMRCWHVLDIDVQSDG